MMATTVRAIRFLGPGLLAAGIALLAAGFALGEATLSLVLIIPVITATGPWSFLGILLIVAGFFTTFLFWPARMADVPPPVAEPLLSDLQPPVRTPQPVERRWGGVVFLGPFPIVFGSDQRVTRLMLALGVVLFSALLALTIIALMA